jgi:hypothetical protein
MNAWSINNGCLSRPGDGSPQTSAQIGAAASDQPKEGVVTHRPRMPDIHLAVGNAKYNIAIRIGQEQNENDYASSVSFSPRRRPGSSIPRAIWCAQRRDDEHR